MGESPHGSMIWEWGLQLGVRLGAGSGSGSASSAHKSHLRNRQKVDQRANQLVACTVGGKGEAEMEEEELEQDQEPSICDQQPYFPLWSSPKTCFAYAAFFSCAGA